VTIPANLTVSVSGTSVTAQVDAAGRFSLLNVPPGNADLRFNAPGVLANVVVTGLEAGQVVSITVSLTPTTAAIESDHRSLGRETQLEGRVESLPPTTPALTLVVAGRTVTTDASTQFLLHGSPATFASLELGQRVHVKGEASGTSLLAREVKIQNTNTGTGLNLNGVISGFSGTPAAFEFTVNGQLVKGDTGTVFFGNSEFAQLVDGAIVEVKGSQRSGFVYAVRIHVEREEIEFTGVITAPITGTAPDLSFLVDSTIDHTVLTSAGTDVQRKGDKQTPAQLRAGMTVEVSGELLANGKVLAGKIHILGDAVGGEFQMSGSIGGLSGTCPTLSFSVSGYEITTTAVAPATVFTPSCASLSNGTKVTVKGTVLVGGSISATNVEKQ
jgi:hypothetical protein